MDRNYYYQQHAREQQAAISKELATRHLLQEARPNVAKRRQALRIALRVLPAAIAVGILILYRLLG